MKRYKKDIKMNKVICCNRYCEYSTCMHYPSYSWSCDNYCSDCLKEIKCSSLGCNNTSLKLYIDRFKNSSDRDGRVFKNSSICDFCNSFYCQDCEFDDLMSFDGYSEVIICSSCWDNGIKNNTIIECLECKCNRRTIKCLECSEHFCLGCYDFENEIKECQYHLTYKDNCDKE